jgi:hypothetical protein
MDSDRGRGWNWRSVLAILAALAVIGIGVSSPPVIVRFD